LQAAFAVAISALALSGWNDLLLLTLKRGLIVHVARSEQ